MKKIFLILVLIGLAFLPTFPAFPADYYISSTGRDVAAGTSVETAWRTLDRFNQEDLAAGDVIYLTGTSLAPVRGSLAVDDSGTSGNEITFTGLSGNSYVISSYDISDGGTYLISNDFNADRNRWLQDWVDGTNADDWVEVPGTESITRDGSNQLIGNYCMNITIDSTASLAYSKLEFNSLPAENVQMKVIYKTTAAGELSLDVRDLSDDAYVQSDGSWDAALYRPTLPASTVWVESSAFPQFTPRASYGNFRVQVLTNNANSTTYIQAIIFEVTNSWEVYSGDVYELNVFSTDASLGVSKCSADDWVGTGVDALRTIEEGSGKDSLSAGEWYWDNAADRIYYKLASGESSMSDVHLELMLHADGFLVSGDYVDLNTITFASAQTDNIENSGDYISYTNCDFIAGWRYGARDTVGSIVNYAYCNFYNNRNSSVENSANGHLCDGGVSTITWSKAYDNGDDGFQVASSGVFTLSLSLSYGNLSTQFTQTLGEAYLYNNVFYSDDKIGYDVDSYPFADTSVGGETRVYRNNIVVSERDLTSDKVVHIANATGITESNNLWYHTSIPGAYVSTPWGDTAGVNTDPKISSSWKLKYNSPVRRSKNLGIAIIGVNGTGTTDLWGITGIDGSIPIGAYFGGGVRDRTLCVGCKWPWLIKLLEK